MTYGLDTKYSILDTKTMLYFITGNKNKFEEVKAALAPINIEQLDIDLPEIQEFDAKEILKAKLEEALAHQKGEFIVEDTSLYIDALNGLPGPLIKWFMKALGRKGIAELASKYDSQAAQAKAILGYAKSHDEIYYFEGVTEGKIVSPRGDSDFGWDPIFEVAGAGKTYAEMGPEEKNKISHRKKAVEKLKEFLESH